MLQTVLNEKVEHSMKSLGSVDDIHRQLAKFNRKRLSPTFPSDTWEWDLEENFSFTRLEGGLVEAERKKLQSELEKVPRSPEAFLDWFENLKFTGPGQNDPLFPWLAEEATMDQMKWFIQQETAGEAGFEDLTALTQVRVSTRAKLEMARNYWDEMGRGQEKGMHGPMLTKLAGEMNLSRPEEDDVIPEALALANMMTALATNRRYTYQSIGALGVIELTAPDRASLVHKGLKRLGLSPEAQRYYSLHSAIDIKHSLEWNKEVLMPLAQEDASRIPAMAEGALLRLNAGARCFDRYRREFGI